MQQSHFDIINHYLEKLRFLVAFVWGIKVRRFIAGIVGLIGLAAAIQQFWPLIFPDTIDILPVASDTIIFDESNQSILDLPTHILMAGTIIVDGISLKVPLGTVFISNYLHLKNHALIQGEDFSVIATRIKDGTLNTSGKTGEPGQPGSSGGTLFVAAGVIEGTLIRAIGGSGGNGRAGEPGPAMNPAHNGRNGKCDGFGRWRKAENGDDGRQGNPGNPGQNGGSGGNGGSILILLSRPDSSLNVLASAGKGGQGGVGGDGGPGQQGGRGGRGCVGAGGAQDSRSNGRDGLPGPKGSDGVPGSDGNDGSAPRRIVPFRDVVETWQRLASQPFQALEAIRQLPQGN